MFAIKLGVRGLANTRFAISPLQEVCALLELVARPERAVAAQLAPLARTRAALRDTPLELLDELAKPGYLPDLLTPHPTDADGDIAAELDAVRSTPASHR